MSVLQKSALLDLYFISLVPEATPMQPLVFCANFGLNTFKPTEPTLSLPQAPK